MLFDIINPSDPYTMKADSLLTAAVAICLLGEGKLAIKQLDGDANVPIFLFGGHDEWFTKNLGGTFQAVLNNVTDSPELADCLDSVLLGGQEERQQFEQELQLLEPEQRDEYRNLWHDERKSSDNDIGRRAWRMAQHLRNRNT